MPDLPADLWQRDESLRAALALIDKSAGRVRAVSFDFFDTLVWRLVANPVDAFHEVGHRLRQRGALPPAISVEDFETLRRLAEFKTREGQKLKDATREDVNIQDIYRQLEPVIGKPAAGIEIECAVERDLCLLNPVMAGFLQQIRRRGLRVLIISDIYFSAEQLRGILLANQFDPALFDTILTSSEAGLCKGSGNLFRHALKKLGLEPEQLLHIGDNAGPDVGGARKAGVRGCHYRQSSPEITTILDREQFLAGGQVPCFSLNSLRLLATRHFAGDSAEDFFRRSGALLLGPLLTRYATWACEQFVAAGVRKVGAFMREGEMLGSLLQHENEARGHGLEIMPLYVNRKSTELAAIGKLTADNVKGWLERRQSLSIRAILEDFGLNPEDARHASFSLEDRPDSHENVLRLAKYLFTPAVAARIEAKSAEERRKVLDYLRPWIESGAPVGLCDLGYNASAQAQLIRILEIEGHPARFIGCYLVTYARAGLHVLDGHDIRHFLGAYGRPNYHFLGFLRSPAFVEQCLTAPIGTTLGYQRAADGTVTPVLDERTFPPDLVRRQRGFKDGVLFFQKLWLWFRAQKPALLDGGSEDSRRLLAELDRSCVTILARATAFPLPEEIAHFGALPLDDYYFAEGVKTICGPQEREIARAGGSGKLLSVQGVLWPQGTFHQENPQVGSDFFSCGKAMLLCQPKGDNNGLPVDLAIVVPPPRDMALLRECLNRLKPVANRNPRYEVVFPAALEDNDLLALTGEFGREFKRMQVLECRSQQTPIQRLNYAMDEATAPWVAFIDPETRLSPDWDTALLRALQADPAVAMVFPTPPATGSRTDAPSLENLLNSLPRTFLIRRSAFVEGLGFHEKLGFAAATWNLLFHLRELGWQAVFCREGGSAACSVASSRMPAADIEFLKRVWSDLPGRATAVGQAPVTGPATIKPRALMIDWVGSFLDHGSLSHVNRELTAALELSPGLHLQRVSNGAPAAQDWENLAGKISTTASADATVTVRHAWPPDWKHPRNGKLVVIQPWEFGALPAEWVKASATVDEFWVPSEYVRRVYAESGVAADKVRVVPNGVNLEKFHPQAAPAKLPTQKKFKFLFVGGTIFRKGPDLLLQAYLENFTADDDVCLVIKDFGGDGVYAGQTFKARIRAAQAQPKAPEILHLDLDLPPDALPGIYTACDCLVLPYRGEGFGLPVVEAMACARPVIVTAGGATDDFVRDDFAWRIPAERRMIGHEISGLKLTSAGWLLEPDGAALGRFLRAAFTNPAETRQRGQRAAAHARQCCSWQNSAAIAAQRLYELGRTDAAADADSGPVAPVAKPAAAPVKITLPPCALVGHVAAARELVRQKKCRVAWEAVVALLARRPFHPEAILVLAEIALTVGDGPTAKLCAEHARRLAPAWKPAKKFLNQRLKGGARPEWLKLPAEVSAPGAPLPARLSVCLIVKNEEKFIGRCLASVHGLAAQIVVVDTGSTDRTVAIAREHGAEIHEFAWCDDFSAARNAALEHVTGDWVLVLDADEELSPDGCEPLLRAMNDPAVMAWRLPLLDEGREASGRTYVPRLFRNAPGLFYVGRVHEQVFSSVEVRRAEWGLENRLGEATLIHHGYTDEMMRDRDKVRRNLLLLERAVGEMPDEPHLLMHLGLELARSGRPAEAIARDLEAFAALSAKSAREIVPELRETLLLQLCTHLTGAKRFDEIVRALTAPLAAVGDGLTASLHFSLGLAQLELRRFREAADQMRQCLAKRGLPSLSLVNTEIQTSAPQHCLALCLASLGEAPGAEQAFQDGLKEARCGEGVRLDYAQFLAGQNRPVEALQQLHQAVAVNPQAAGAWRLGGQIALSRAEFLKFARDWTDTARRNLPADPVILVQRAEALLLSEDLAGALPLWKQCLDQGAGSAEPTVLAALILCELVEAPTTHAPSEAAESAASGAFIKWYRRLLAIKANKTVVRLNGQTEKLARALPGAARLLTSAMSEASRAIAPGVPTH